MAASRGRPRFSPPDPPSRGQARAMRMDETICGQRTTNMGRRAGDRERSATRVLAESFAASGMPGVDVASEGEENFTQGRVAFDLGAGALAFESTSVGWMLPSAYTVKMTAT